MTTEDSSGSMFAIRNCHFRYRCHMEWEDLNLTETSDVRYCATCSKNVYLCKTDSEIERETSNDHCLAIPSDLVEKFDQDDLSPLAKPKPRTLVGMRANLTEGLANTGNLEARRTELRRLVTLGKERGYITRSEIKESFYPEGTTGDRIESIHSTFQDMGIEVRDE
jgi:hypothetical protein